jgi:hypothetical protein
VNGVASCADWFNKRIDACTWKPGKQANSASCLEDAQCSGGRCSYTSSTSSCGTCAAKPAAPACDYDGDCSSNQVCNSAGTCVTPGDVGASCDDSTTLCLYSLYCKGANAGPDAGTTAGKCAAPIADGATCDPGTDFCANPDGCSAQGKCSAIQLVAVGATCDELTLVCKASYCHFPSDTATTGTCTAYAAVGAACDPSNGPFCGAGSDCVNGKCAAETATCP